MRIAIEAQRIFRRNKHGMDFVVLETIRELQQIDKENEYFILVQPGDDPCLQATDNFHIVTISCPNYFLWEQIALPYTLHKIRPDILHCTSNTAPVFCPCPLVLTLHDIIFLEKKTGKNSSLYQYIGRMYRKYMVPRILPRCKKIITVSDFEREHIRTTLQLDEERIIRIYNGLHDRFKPVGNYYPITGKYIPAKEYLFFLGNTDPKKNTRRVLKAYSLYLERSKKRLPLLIADLSEATIDRILEEENIQQVKPSLYLPGYIKNADLPAVYSGAHIFLYPSVRESFGLPLLEAMGCGTPVVSSHTSAIPEIAGEKAVLVNPFCPQEIADKMIFLETNRPEYLFQQEYGLERASLFSWRTTAKELVQCYKSFEI